MAKYWKSAPKNVRSEMRRRRKGTLKSGLQSLHTLVRSTERRLGREIRGTDDDPIFLSGIEECGRSRKKVTA
jgi:hypothetical protein